MFKRAQQLITAAMWVFHHSAGGGDGSETLLLLGLLAVLVLVLRRRAALRTLYGPPPGPLPGLLLAILAATASHRLLQLSVSVIQLGPSCGQLTGACCCVWSVDLMCSHLAAVPDPATAPMRRRSSSAGAAGMAAPAAAMSRQTEQPAGDSAPSSASAGGRPAATPQAHGSAQVAGERRHDERPAPPPRGSLAELRQSQSPERARAQQEAADEAGPSDR